MISEVGMLVNLDFSILVRLVELEAGGSHVLPKALIQSYRKFCGVFGRAWTLN